MMEVVLNMLKLLAVNFGNKHLVLSTALVMVLAGSCWVWFVKSVAGQVKSDNTHPASIVQHSGGGNCTNIVTTGGSSVCKAEQEKFVGKNGENSLRNTH